MQHANILGRENMHQHARLHMTNLHEARLKGADVWIEDGERLWIAFPVDHPITSSTPAIAIDKEAVVSVAQQELGGNALDVDRFDVLLALDEVERRVGLVEQ